MILDIVRRRPTRHGGLRVAIESVSDTTVVHAYGVGGMGYEICWGVGAEVLRLFKKRKGFNVEDTGLSGNIHRALEPRLMI
jgi:hypothetical protein